ncbi:hypothetical protein QQF64_024233 [Cirrhinus molitorella]|uniref:ribonuclease H n=1 Tax=Cirrhinus molitorella TaxID=172907 RepID=A0ABR3NKN0_9TELE
MELDVELCGKIVSECGILVVRDPPGGMCAQVPGILGMNVLSRCYQELFGQHGQALFDSPPVAEPALVPVIRGTVYIPVVKVKEVVATVGSQGCMVGPSLTEQINAVDLSALEVEEQDDVPILQRYRRLPPSEYDVVKMHINQLLEAQIICESCSPYASPIVLGRKKDGSLRMCIDYCQLNSKTRKDAFPLPRIKETLDALTGARWFSTLNLASGYNKVPETEGDKHKTAFCTPFGLFEWNRMLFGLCNAPSTFQHLMERLFGDQRHQSLLLYLDNIVVFSSSVAQHLERLEVVLGQLKWEGLKAKLEKCVFFKQQVKYLGHVVSSQGVATDPGKVEVVANWACPGSVTELRSFIGFALYYRYCGPCICSTCCMSGAGVPGDPSRT